MTERAEPRRAPRDLLPQVQSLPPSYGTPAVQAGGPVAWKPRLCGQGSLGDTWRREEQGRGGRAGPVPVNHSGPDGLLLPAPLPG